MDEDRDLEGRTPAQERFEIGTPAGESPTKGARRHGTIVQEAERVGPEAGVPRGSPLKGVNDETTASGPALDLSIQDDMGHVPDAKAGDRYSFINLEQENPPVRAVDVETVAETEGEEIPEVKDTQEGWQKRKPSPGKAAGGGLAIGGHEVGTGGRMTGGKAGAGRAGITDREKTGGA